MIKFILVFFILSFSVNSSEIKNRERVYIKKNATLYAIDSGNEIKVTKGFFADVIPVSEETRNQFYVYNKIGKAKYTVDGNYISDISNDIQLLPNEKFELNYNLKNNAINTDRDKRVLLQTDFILNYDSLNLGSLGGISGSEKLTLNSPRYSISTFTNTNFSFQIGLVSNFQSANWNDQSNNKYTLDILSFGPALTYQISNSDKLNLKTSIAYEFSPIYNLQTEGLSTKFNGNIFSIGLATNLNSDIGYFSLGAIYRLHSLTLNSTELANSKLQTDEYTINSFGLFVGYKLNWEL